MKKRIILFGSLLTVFLLVMLPSISAIEYNEIINEKETKLKETLGYKNTELLKNKISNYLKNDQDLKLIDLIKDIIGLIVVFFVFNSINLILKLFVPNFISNPLVLMMKLIQYFVYGAITLDMIRTIFF